MKSYDLFLIIFSHSIILAREELDSPAESIMRHRLNEILESAIRDTNAQYEDSEILQRLNVEVLETTDGRRFSSCYHLFVFALKVTVGGMYFHWAIRWTVLSTPSLPPIAVYST